ncbi:MAG: 50S ribosomal protein L5 [Candidatus Pacebacteria bacterium]|jgi:large subunit ribosomal protein L5|nr:50S ribosomal protein L5 [bacterium]MDP6527300.1 50S ribosomal protein L5 [Candidatus Paceibacterota bacterium]MDP6659422.1 50S ribosomal protein L5 [Candidatus Paceibacterota bacterium]|tara:strand:- start:14983 stop:15522 length:540 start_codon:yes stop_codon:yes gene_type:complete
MQITKEKQNKMFEVLKGVLGFSNVMQTPRVEKVVISTGVGKLKDKKKFELITDRLSKITGQKPSARPAKKSIASFKVREGDTSGYQVTLRGARMHDFLDKLIHIALPRTRDFRGISPNSIDEMGNLTIGVKEHTIFPETSDEDLRDVFGMSITLVTSVEDKETAKAFLTELGIPFKKEE